LLLLGVLLLLAHQQGGVDGACAPCPTIHAYVQPSQPARLPDVLPIPRAPASDTGAGRGHRGALHAAAKKKKKRKKGKARKPPANGDQRCVACRRMLGHLESSLADEFNRMDRRVKGQAKSAAARGSDFDPTTARGMRLANLERMPAVDASLKSVCGATGLMRPELGTDCKRLLEDHIDDFESVLVNHEKYGGRPGMAKELCWKVASVCPEGADWDSKGFKRRAALTDADFRSEPIPRATEQPGIKGGIFKLVGKTVADAISEEGKDVFIHYRFPGTTFDDTYYKAWHDFGLLVHGTELEKTVLLAEIDVDANELPGGPPVGGEYVEAPCIVLYPAQVKHSPTYILLHTDPELSVKRQGPDFFWQWLNTHGQKETKWAVEELAQQRQLSGIQAPAVVDKKPAQALQKTKKKKKKPKHKREDAMVIPRQRVSTNSGVRPESYDRDSILTPELVCSACMVVIDEVEYSLRKLKDVGATVGRRLDAQGRGVSKRLNPGRNIVNVVEAMEHACDLTQEYGVSGTGKGQRWVRINAREQGEAILIESATVEAESPLKLTGSCSSFLEKYEDELEHALLHADPDTSIQDEFCMYHLRVVMIANRTMDCDWDLPACCDSNTYGAVQVLRRGVQRGDVGHDEAPLEALPGGLRQGARRRQGGELRRRHPHRGGVGRRRGDSRHAGP
jgi:hypothetical protein